jgi:pyridoxamine 5'-phosphate oxidase
MTPSPLDPPPDPLALFATWYDDAKDCSSIHYPGAMCCATISPDGFPENRVVLLHDAGAEGFAFFTDRRSGKGRSLAQVPRAALAFYWGPQERQVRVQGAVEQGTGAEADAFFAERPRRSKGTAWASPQSQPIAQAELDRRVQAVDDRYAEGEPIPRPPYWQVYWVRPRMIEFWEARSRRLHERFRYTRDEKGSWTCRRLAP